MQKCSYCGDDLQENTRFCGKCGSVQDALATNAAVTRSHTAQPQSWVPEGGTILATWPPSSNDPAQGSMPTWSPNAQASGTPPPPPTAENEDERRRGIPPWSPLYGDALGADALLGSGQTSTATLGTPVVQGTPQIGSVPSVAGSPTLSMNTPVSHPAPGAGNAAPVSHPVQEPGNAAPISHPVQGPGNVPVNHPVQEPPPIHHPPQPPGTHKPHPPHKPHRHHSHPEQHEPHRVVKTKAVGSSAVKTIILVVTAVVVVAAGGIAAAAHFLSRPQPLISITSNYKMGNALAGASGTILHISGKKFSGNSAITFLLDGHVAPGNPGTRSDANGTFSADVTVTDAWSVGTHTLTAKDASNYSTKTSVSVTIVQPGQANTPGPNGAPPDDATFTLNISAPERNNTVNQSFTNNDEALHITGHPDPVGGTVCLNSDNGQQISSSYVSNISIPFTETYSFSCQGSYKSGKVSYTETLLTDVITFTDGSGISCTLISPQLNQQMTGSYTGNGTFTGTWTYGPVPVSDFSCSDQSQSFYYTSSNGTWTGTVSDLQK